MGYQFQIRDANIVAYLTRERIEEPPRLTGDDMVFFLRSLTHPEGSLISQDATWMDRISRIASHSYEKHAAAFKDTAYRNVDESLLGDALADLRKIFCEYDLYALPLGAGGTPHIHGWLRKAALASKHHALMLMPIPESDSVSIDIFDPAPPIRRIAENPDCWPGVLFWTRGANGGECFAPTRDADKLFNQLSRQFDHGSEALSTVLDKYNSAPRRTRPNRILQLSDLHFGTDEARRREAYFKTYVTQMLPEMDRIVMTGDLLDSPKEQDFWEFDRFYTELRNASLKDPILVAGNHDQRMYGNKIGTLGENAKFLARIQFSPSVIVDDEIRCIFLVFNSSEMQDFARGEVSSDQRRRVATQLINECTRRPKIRGYSRIALVHHHPIPYAPEEAQPIQRGLLGLFVGAEQFIEMRGSEEFLLWCAKQKVSLILHGHKHLPRHRREAIFEDGRFLREITAAGCGASLGKGTERLSYNIITWNPEDERWAAAFYSGAVDGGGFGQDFMTLYQANLERRSG
ncbi:putative phosphodiesterase [Streptomyces canus]|uniref:Phosphodiesterase n=1 Tax=Streptomyces canus TaxID=58343 RepID=A0AAW8FJX2_9ACTN|nr:metallophosphoesterase [Streptomyces canus]MDQ0909370.1 putative phosphodiesterase [Streptomyces canus]